MKVIAVNNNKGGVLKTSIVTNLAGVLVEQGNNILIIDCDNQSNVSISFGINPDQLENTLYEVLIENAPAEKAIITGYTSDKGKRIDILPSSDSLIGLDFTVIGNREAYPRPFEILKNKCSHLIEKYDYVLCDSMPSMALMTGNLFTFADSVLIPYSPEQYSMRSLVKVLETIGEFKESFNPSLEVLGVVATLVNYQTTLHQEIMQETRKYCFENDVTMYETYIPRSIRFASSVAYNQLPATITEKTNKAVQCYFELWKELKANG